MSSSNNSVVRDAIYKFLDQQIVLTIFEVTKIMQGLTALDPQVLLFNIFQNLQVSDTREDVTGTKTGTIKNLSFLKN
jgi:hypothetical protein